MKNNDRIKDLRIDNDLSQDDVADILGVVQQTYSPWELGYETIPLKHLNTLSNYYKVSMDYILGFTDKKNYPNEKNFKSLSKDLVGENIRIIRSDFKLSLRKLASILDTTSSTISAYETGKTLLLSSFAIDICKKYKLSMDWICGKSNIKYLNKKQEKN